MRTPKGMIRAFLTPDEVEQLKACISIQIIDLKKEFDGLKSNAAKEAICHVLKQLEDRLKAFAAMKAPPPRKIGRPRGSKNSEVKPAEQSESASVQPRNSV